MDLRSITTEGLEELQEQITNELVDRQTGYLEAARSNPRMTREMWADFIRNKGRDLALANVARASGRTTAVALSAIGAAMREPGKAIYVVDHAHTPMAVEGLVNRTKQLVTSMGLEHISIRLTHLGGIPQARVVYEREL